MMLVTEDGLEPLGDSQEFTVKAVPNTVSGTDFEAVAAFQKETSDLLRQARGAAAELGQARDQLRYMRAALEEMPTADAELRARLEGFEERLAGLAKRLQGDPARRRLNEPGVPTILGRLSQVAGGHWNTRQAPTETQRSSLGIARDAFATLSAELTDLLEGELARLEADMEAAGAPWTPGREGQRGS